MNAVFPKSVQHCVRTGGLGGREIDGWSVSSAHEEEIVSKNTFLQVVKKVRGRPRASSVSSWWRLECINESVVEVRVPRREETEEVMRRLVEVPILVSRQCPQAGLRAVR